MRTTHRDLSYAMETGRGHLLDLYLPAGDGPFPVLIYHGGSAFRSDDTKSDAAPSQDVASAQVRHRRAECP